MGKKGKKGEDCRECCQIVLPFIVEMLKYVKFVGKKNTPQVWLYEVVDGVHSWFNEDMDTAGEIWKFFQGVMGK